MRLDNHDAAVRDFDRAIELDTGDAESYYERGSARVVLGAYFRAVGDLEQSLRLNPDHPFAEYDREVASALAMGRVSENDTVQD